MKKIFLFAVLLVSLNSFAETRIQLVGMGADSCELMMSNIDEYPEMRFTYISWWQGYLSGLSLMADERENVIVTFPDGFEAYELWIHNYCRQNPLRQVADAAVTLFAELMERQKN